MCITADVLDAVVHGPVYISTLLGRCTRYLGHASVGRLVHHYTCTCML